MITINVTPIDVFEELRFVWELMAAELLLVLPFAEKRPHLRRNCALTFFLLSILSLGYFPYYSFLLNRLRSFTNGAIGGWYIFLALSVFQAVRGCFQLGLADSLFFGVSSYAMQHTVYTLVHEFLQRGIWTSLGNHLLLYITLSLLACLLCYYPMVYFCSKKLSGMKGPLIQDNPKSILGQFIVLVILMYCTFMCQHIFEFFEDTRYNVISLDVMICVLVQWVEYTTLSQYAAVREQTAIAQLLKDSEAHFRFSKELIDKVNRSCHDIKHQLQALPMSTDEEREHFIQETLGNLKLYSQLISSDNEILNTILAEKALYCDEKEIDFSCSVDHVDLSFMKVTDLYTILGNLMDNAIEHVSGFAEKEKRTFNLTIQTHQAFVSIQTNNFVRGETRLVDGLPLTSKPDRLSHGYGLKSVRYLVQKYGGNVVVSGDDHIFTVQIMIPVPAEAS